MITIIFILIGIVVLLSLFGGDSHYNYYQPPTHTSIYTHRDDWRDRPYYYQQQENFKVLLYTIMFMLILILWLKYDSNYTDNQADINAI